MILTVLQGTHHPVGPFPYVRLLQAARAVVTVCRDTEKAVVSDSYGQALGEGVRRSQAAAWAEEAHALGQR